MRTGKCYHIINNALQNTVNFKVATSTFKHYVAVNKGILRFDISMKNLLAVNLPQAKTHLCKISEYLTLRKVILSALALLNYHRQISEASIRGN